jgi:HSP20 family molecular chaperone IbpA
MEAYRAAALAPKVMLALVGFRPEMDIVTQQNQLLVTGRKEEGSAHPGYLHLGIAAGQQHDDSRKI